MLTPSPFLLSVVLFRICPCFCLIPIVIVVPFVWVLDLAFYFLQFPVLRSAVTSLRFFVYLDNLRGLECCVSVSANNLIFRCKYAYGICKYRGIAW